MTASVTHELKKEQKLILYQHKLTLRLGCEYELREAIVKRRHHTIK